MYYSVLPFAEMMKGKEGTVMALFNCSFDSSTIIFVLYKIISFASNWRLQSFFLSYNLIAGVVMVLAIIYPSPPTDYRDIPFQEEKKEEERKLMENSSKIIDEETALQSPSGKSKSVEYDGVYEALSFKEVFKKAYLYWSSVYYIVVLFWLDSYIGFAEQRVQAVTSDPEEVDRLVTVFSFIMPASILASPLIGYIIDKKGYAFTLVIAHAFILVWAIFVWVEAWPNFQIAIFISFRLGILFILKSTF